MDQLPTIVEAIKMRIADEFDMPVVVETGLFNNKPYGICVLYCDERMRMYLRDNAISINATVVEGPNFGNIEDYWPDEDEFPGVATYWTVDLFDHDFWEQICNAIESWIANVDEWRYRVIAEEYHRTNKKSWKLL